MIVTILGVRDRVKRLVLLVRYGSFSRFLKASSNQLTHIGEKALLGLDDLEVSENS